MNRKQRQTTLIIAIAILIALIFVTIIWMNGEETGSLVCILGLAVCGLIWNEPDDSQQDTGDDIMQ